jgi:hypothetical protein
MTQDEFAARKRRITMVAGIGIFALLSSYTVGYAAPDKARAAMLLTAIFFGCIFIAARMAFKLKKEITPQ